MASRKLKLKCSDGVTMEVEETVALEWQTIKQIREGDVDDDSDVVIPLGKVSSDILLKVIEYTKKHLQITSNSHDRKADSDLKTWDAEFVKVDVNTLYHLILTANYLNIPILMDLLCMRTADMIAGKKVEDVRKTFNIISDYTPEEEEDMRQQSPWAFN